MCDNRYNSSSVDDRKRLTYEFQPVLDKPSVCMFLCIASCTDGRSSTPFHMAVDIADGSLWSSIHCEWDAYIQ